MADIIPPAPTGVPPGHSFWNQWYESIRVLINGIATTIVSWVTIDFTGSNVTDIVNRSHNDLQSFQGGSASEYYHLTSTQHTRATTVISKAGTPTTSDIAAGQWAVYKDTSGGTVRIWTNDGGTMKSATLT